MLRVAIAVILTCAGPIDGQTTESDQIKQPFFTMSIASKENTVRPGDEVIIGVEITNVSAKEIQILSVGSGPPQYGFKVFDHNGKPAPLTPLGEAMVNGRSCYTARNGETRCIPGGSNISQNRIAPGKKWPDAFPLSYYVDFGQPGQYTIRLERSDPYTKLLVLSNSVTITVAKRE
jgi:hypothetical protein